MSAFPNLTIHKASEPTFVRGGKYSITATLFVQLPGDNNQISESTTQGIQIAGTALELNSSLIDSVYPPEGHADQWFTLPHVIFTNAQVPWSAVPIGATEASTSPYMALIVCRDDELRYDANFLATLNPVLGSSDFPVSETKALQMSYAQYLTYTGETLDGEVTPMGNAQVVFVDNQIWTSYYNANPPSNSVPQDFNMFAHVRQSTEEGSAPVSVIVSPRTGPVNVFAPLTVRAHLIALPGPVRTSRPAQALVSLHSWSYTCTPTNHFDFVDTFTTLGQNCQPLRCAGLESRVSSETNLDRVADRAWAGYSPARYIPNTGESLIAMYRGLLSPIPLPLSLMFSNDGEDLAVIDNALGILDLTYQIAWQLGRSLTISNPNLAASIMRLRGAIHSKCLAKSKGDLDATTSKPVYRPISSALNGLRGTLTALSGRATSVASSDPVARWQAVTTPSTRAYVAFNYQGAAGFPVFQTYQNNLQSMADAITSAWASSSSSPQTGGIGTLGLSASGSVDFTTVATWVLDKFLLKGIPWQNLVSDPIGFLPSESIRTFYIDPSWMAAFIDGAISIGERFTIGDEVRTCFKNCVSKLDIATPKWGFFVRSQLITKYPKLSVIAPRSSLFPIKDTSIPDCLRAEAIGKDLFLALFDRVPGNNMFPDGVALCPPAHHLRFQLGDPSAWSAATSPVPTSITLQWRNFTDSSGQVYQPPAGSTQKTYTLASDGSGIYNPASATLYGAALANDIQTIFQPSGVESSATLLATQLLASTPVLVLNDNNTTVTAQVSPKGSPTPSLPSQHPRDIAPETQLPTDPDKPFLDQNFDSVPREETSPAPTLSVNTTFTGPPCPPVPVPNYPPSPPTPTYEPYKLFTQVANTTFFDVDMINTFLVFDTYGPHQTPNGYFQTKIYNSQTLLDPSRLSATINPLPNNPKRRHIISFDQTNLNIPSDLHIEFERIPPGPSSDTAWYTGSTIDSIKVEINVGNNNESGVPWLLRKPPSPPNLSQITVPPNGLTMQPNQDFFHIQQPLGVAPFASVTGPMSAYFNVSGSFVPGVINSLFGTWNGTYVFTITPSSLVPKVATGCGPITLTIRDVHFYYNDNALDDTGGYKAGITFTENVADENQVLQTNSTVVDGRVFWANVYDNFAMLGKINGELITVFPPT